MDRQSSSNPVGVTLFIFTGFLLSSILRCSQRNFIFPRFFAFCAFVLGSAYVTFYVTFLTTIYCSISKRIDLDGQLKIRLSDSVAAFQRRAFAP